MRERPGYDPNASDRVGGLTEAEENEAGTPRGGDADKVVDQQRNRTPAADDKDEL